MEKVFYGLALPDWYAKKCAYLVKELGSMRLSKGTSCKHVMPLTEAFDTGSSTRLHTRLVKLKAQKGLRVITARPRSVDHDRVSNVLYLSFDGEEPGQLGRYITDDLGSIGIKANSVPEPLRVRLAEVVRGYRLSRAVSLAKECAPHYDKVDFDTLGIYSDANKELLHPITLAA